MSREPAITIKRVMETGPDRPDRPATITSNKGVNVIQRRQVRASRFGAGAAASETSSIKRKHTINTAPNLHCHLARTC